LGATVATLRLHADSFRVKTTGATRRGRRSKGRSEVGLERSIRELADLHRELGQVLADIVATAERWEKANGRIPTPGEVIGALHSEVRAFVDTFFRAFGGKMNPRRGRPQWPEHKFQAAPVVRLLKLARAHAEATKSDESKRRARLLALAVKLEDSSISVAAAVSEARRIRGDNEVTEAAIKLSTRRDRRMSSEARVKRIYTQLAWDAPVDIRPDTRDGHPRGKMKEAINQALKLRDVPRVPVDAKTAEVFRRGFIRDLEHPGAATKLWRILEPGWFEKS
jgi:hypothetical protein